MNKTGLIIRREYLSRVRKKTFIISTLLTPLLFAALIIAVVLLTIRGVRHEKVAVIDPAGIFKSTLDNSKLITYDFSAAVDTSNFAEKGYSVLLLPPNTDINKTGNFKIITEKSLSRMANERIEKDISRFKVRNYIINEAGIYHVFIR